MNDLFKKDWKHYKHTEWKGTNILRLMISQNMRYMFTGRMSQCSGIIGKIYGIINNHQGKKMGNEICFSVIEGGCVLRHPYGITVGSEAKIGLDATLYKGCTVGTIRSGVKAGTPIIGDRVVICSNATVVGGVHIGNDVLISAGAFVNFDVPDHSVVIGNPGVIHRKENASREYLW